MIKRTHQVDHAHMCGAFGKAAHDRIKRGVNLSMIVVFYLT